MITAGTVSISKRDPLAAAESTVVIGHARFQFLTDRMLRLEWARDSVFEDRASVTVLNRNLPPVAITRQDTAGCLTLSTGMLTVCYVPDGRPFHAGNLSIRVKSADSVRDTEIEWRPGMKDAGNLGGTLRTLDRMDGAVLHYNAENANPSSPEPVIRLTKNISLGDGFISKNGWSFQDDSPTACIEITEDGLERPVQRRDGERLDWYFCGHGRDYKAALYDAGLVFGRQPLPPRYAFGYWWSRFWAYTDGEFEDLVDTFRRMNLPLSVLVVDMDWHLEGWTGYTWDERFFPDPERFLASMKDRGLRVALNIHPHEGIGRHEKAYGEMAEALGLNDGSGETIPFDVADPRFTDLSFRLLHRPLEKIGVDFWWVDWQQGETSGVKGLDPLPWLNHLYWSDMEKNRERGNRRPIVFSRYGGPGSGRYPIGFSGDTYQTWESLSFQPYFTATAANVLYGYWSHDIGGHFADTIDPELYLRWLQWGLYSPVLRTHAQRRPEAERRVWEYTEPYGPLMRDVLRKRHRLIPYIYTEARKAHESGLSVCRPLYYDHPYCEEAYERSGEYRFGDSFIVSPVTSPVSRLDGTAGKNIRLPEGPWIDTATGSLRTGGKIFTERYLPEEIPVFVRPGTIIPELQESAEEFLTASARSYTRLGLSIWPGAPGSYELYEDDGETTGYLEGELCRIRMKWVENGSEGIFTIDPVDTGYEGFLSKKNLEISLHACPPPGGVEAGGRVLPFSVRRLDGTWRYDGNERMLVISAGDVDLKNGFSLSIAKQEGFETGGDEGLPGVLRRLRKAMSHVRLLFSLKDCHPGERVIIGLAQTGRRISLKPQNYSGEIAALKAGLRTYPDLLGTLRNRFRPDDCRYEQAEAARRILEASAGLFSEFLNPGTVRIPGKADE